MKESPKNRKSRFLAGLLSLCMIIPAFSGLISLADKTPGTTGHTADGSTMDSYAAALNLAANSRYAGRVWADKSVFTNGITLDMATDGYNGPITNDSDFLHVFSALGSSQVVNEKENVPLDVVFILDFSTSMAQTNTNQAGSRFQKTVDAVNDAINTLFSFSPESRVGIATYGDTATQLLPLVKLIPKDGETNTQWLEITSYSIGTGGTAAIRNKAAKTAISPSAWSDDTLINKSSTLTSATNLQAGLAAGMGMLAEVTNNATLTDATTDDDGNYYDNDGIIDMKLVNNRAPLLPGTGGIGLVIFYVVGGLLLAGAAAYIVISGKKKAKEQ